MRALEVIVTDKPPSPSHIPHFARHDLDVQVSIDGNMIPNGTLEEELSRSRNSSTRLRSPTAEMGFLVGVDPSPIWEVPCEWGLFVHTGKLALYVAKEISII